MHDLFDLNRCSDVSFVLLYKNTFGEICVSLHYLVVSLSLRQITMELGAEGFDSFPPHYDEIFPQLPTAGPPPKPIADNIPSFKPVTVTEVTKYDYNYFCLDNRDSR